MAPGRERDVGRRRLLGFLGHGREAAALRATITRKSLSGGLAPGLSVARRQHTAPQFARSGLLSAHFSSVINTVGAAALPLEPCALTVS
jgi:hypothetical protein